MMVLRSANRASAKGKIMGGTSRGGRLSRAWGVVLKACFVLSVLGGACAVANAQGAGAYPSQRVTIVVGFAAGGPVDVIARLIADRLQARWGQPVVVENRPGAGGNLAAALVARAAPDGTTLLFTATGLVINQSLYDHPGYGPNDLIPLSFSAINNLLLAVHADEPARTLAEFIAGHRQKSFTVGTAGVGSGAHLTAEYVFKVLAHAPVVHTPFQGASPATTALLGRHIDMISVAVPDAAQQVLDGKLRGLAVSGAARSQVLPDVPTLSEAGFPGFAAQGWIALFAPARIPPPIAAALNGAVNDILETPDGRERLAALGFTANVEGLQQTRERLDREQAIWQKMVETLGLKIK
jgi:tripartite-type tricarboxylate transporter receptor subunit TctC